MTPRPSIRKATIRLAFTMSVIAAAAAILLHSLGVASQDVIVLGVIVVAFATSWVRTARQQRSASHSPHRVVTVPVRGVHYPVS
jgi:hypothetical protein